MEERRLASELLHEIKLQSKRKDVIIIILIILFFVSNMAWLVAWNLPSDVVTESYELQGEDDANVIYNSEGEVSVNGKETGLNNYNQENTNKKDEQTTK